MFETERRPSGEMAEGREAKFEAESRPDEDRSGDFNEAEAADLLSSRELRTDQEVRRMVAEVKDQIDQAFEQASRDQEKFGDWVRANPEVTAKLGRFLEFMNKLKQERT